MVTNPQEHFECGKEMLMQISQSLLEAKKMARSLENVADSLRPLANSEVAKSALQEISEHSQHAAANANKIYHLIAREAMKP